jgi:hypothetical protein
MPNYESYRAHAKLPVVVGAEAAEAVILYTIEVRFMGGLTETQKDAFKGAADRWSNIIVGDLPPVSVDGEIVDDVLILAQGVEIDGPGQILGQAGPTFLRPPNAGLAAFLPAKGRMSFDTADLANMEANGTLQDVITHEMGHVLGIGTLWQIKGVLDGRQTPNPTFTGAAAMAEYGVLRGDGAGPVPVPVENTGGSGTRDAHWREMIFRNELMSGFIAGAGNPISRVTAGSLQDLGYVVNLDAAEPYELPDLLKLAESGELVPHIAPIGEGFVLPSIPIVLPEDSLQ